jgi:hypothetical protein
MPSIDSTTLRALTLLLTALQVCAASAQGELESALTRHSF